MGELYLFNVMYCRLETIDGTAEAVKDYIPVRQTVAFAPNEVLQHVDIAIVDDNEWEPDEVFFVKLSLEVDDEIAMSFFEVDDDSAQTAVLGKRPTFEPAVLGKRAIQEITILNDDSTFFWNLRHFTDTEEAYGKLGLNEIKEPPRKENKATFGFS